MKRLAFLLLLSMTGLVVSAQNSKVNSAITYSKDPYNELDKAKTAIDTAVVHEKTKNNAKAWKVRGDVYLAITKTTDDKYKSLCSNSLDVAIESYKKAIELDVKKQFTPEITLQFTVIGNMQINNGVVAFNEGKFEKAFNAFKSSLEIDSITTPGTIDTVIVFNTAIAADRAKLYDQAIYFYRLCASMKYEGPKVYGFIAVIEREQGDTNEFVNVLKEGIESYPDNNSVLMVELINYYLKKDLSDQALAYISKAIERDPNNATFYFAQGALYDKLKNFEMAKSAYENAIARDTMYFDAYYNLGALYFNKGADMLKEANNIPSNKQKEYDAAVKESLKELAKALPYLERAHEIDKQERTTMLTLKEIYYKLSKDNEDFLKKFNNIEEELKVE